MFVGIIFFGIIGLLYWLFGTEIDLIRATGNNDTTL